MTSYAWAVPGAQCVCIDPRIPFSRYDIGHSLLSRLFRYPFRDKLVRRRIYTIRSTCRVDGYRYLELDGVKSVFFAGLFRPLVTRTIEQDVALFAPILHGQPVEA